MKFVNLTPHAINEKISGQTFAPSGSVARVATGKEYRGDFEGIPTYRTTYGKVVGLPQPQDGVVYIVSGMVLAAISGRNDVFAPGELVRDENGNPIGCEGFKVN